MIAKRRMDRNEPVWGWQRKQFLEEQENMNTSSTETTKSAGGKKKKVKQQKDMESIAELMELRHIEQGVIERTKNEYLMILSTDFVNFHLLQPGERTAILEGYQQLYNVINFPVQLLAQAVRHDFRKERFYFEENLKKCNVYAAKYNRDVLDFIESKTQSDFRITLRIYYVVKYIYEPSKLAKLTKEQRERTIRENVFLRAEIVRRALRRAKIEADYLNSIEAAEVFKRSLNRDRMILHPIEDVAIKDKLTPVVTLDFSTIPEIEGLVNNLEEALEVVGIEEERKETVSAV